MRNKHAGICYRCLKVVAVGDGHFHKHQGRWVVHHAECALLARDKRTQLDYKSNLA